VGIVAVNCGKGTLWVKSFVPREGFEQVSDILCVGLAGLPFRQGAM
jgi:hypothetical protein